MQSILYGNYILLLIFYLLSSLLGPVFWRTSAAAISRILCSPNYCYSSLDYFLLTRYNPLHTNLPQPKNYKEIRFGKYQNETL
jgi:hypothetical protein